MKPYHSGASENYTIAQLFEQAVRYKDVSTMMMLLGLMPLEEIKLDALSAWENVGFDLILQTPRLQQHSQYSEFIRSKFCHACRELNANQVRRFGVYASESDQMEGFLLVLLHDFNRSSQVFENTKKNVMFENILKGMSYNEEEEKKVILDILIQLAHDNVLQQVSETLHMHAMGLPNQQLPHILLWEATAQNIQNERLKRTAIQSAEDIEKNAERNPKRKM